MSSDTYRALLLHYLDTSDGVICSGASRRADGPHEDDTKSSTCFRFEKIDWSPIAETRGCEPGSAEYDMILYKGSCVDRYGSDSGQYLGPCGSSYTERSIPYIQADSKCEQDYEQVYRTKMHPLNNYHQYEVQKPIRVKACHAAPFCGHVGGSEQYRIASISDNFDKSPPTIRKLVEMGYLREKAFDEYVAPKFGSDLLRKFSKSGGSSSPSCYLS